MSLQNRPSTSKKKSEKSSLELRLKKIRTWTRMQIEKIRAWLRTRNGRIALPIASLILGILFGISLILLYAGAISVRRSEITTPVPPLTADVVVQVGPTFLTRLVANNLSSAGMPGSIGKVRVSLIKGDQITIDGDDTFSMLGFGVTRHFTLVLQPYVSVCQLHVHVVEADLSGIPITGFVAAFEDQINAQLEVKPSGLPSGFTYCLSSVHTETGGLFMTYSATPI